MTLAAPLPGVPTYPYRDPTLPVDDRVEDLLARMTLSEKVAQLGGAWFGHLVTDGELDGHKLELALRHGIGHVTRIAVESGRGPESIAAYANQIQRFLRERTRLGIPALIHEEALAGMCARGAAQFPQAIGLASTWDPAVVEAVATSCRRHLRAVGAGVALAPVVDIARDPRWGRLEETYGEDPELASRMAVAYVRGLQGGTADLAQGVAATAKHFLGHGVPDGGFNHGAVSIGPRQLRDVFAAPFRAAIHEAGLANVMSAYHEVDGLPCSGSAELLSGILREELAFDGVVLADYWAVTHLETFHHVAGDGASAARQAVEAGVDVELPALDRYRHLEALVEAGELDVAVVDRAVTRVVRQKFLLGLFEAATVDERAAPLAFDTVEDRALARLAAARSLILLRNDGTLPLDPCRLHRVAVLGPAAADGRLLLGDYHYAAQAEAVVEPSPAGFGPRLDDLPVITPLEGLRRALPDSVVGHVAGAPLTGDAHPDQVGRAVAAARRADVAIVCVGGLSGVTPAATSGELRDAAHLELPPGQRHLVTAVAATGTPTVVVVVSGRAHALTVEAAAASALVLAWLPGEEGGSALGDVLTGRTSPGGRLPVSLLRTAGQVGVSSGHPKGGGSSQAFGPYVDEPSGPLFCFGHGLSYTTFEYDNLAVTGASTSGTIRIAVTVRNTGTRPGDEVTQVYARDEVTSVGQPERRLVAFARVNIAAGEARRLIFDVPVARLGFSGRDGRFVVEPGRVTFLVGSSHDDIRASARVDITGDADHPNPNTVPAFRHAIEGA